MLLDLKLIASTVLTFIQWTQVDRLAQDLPAAVFEAQLDVAQQLHFLAVHARMLAGQNADRTVAQDVEVVPVGPGVQRRAVAFGHLAEMLDEFALVEGGDGAVGRDQSGVEVIVIDTFQRIDVILGGPVDEVIHRRAHSCDAVGVLFGRVSRRSAVGIACLRQRNTECCSGNRRDCQTLGELFKCHVLLLGFHG